jgi:RHS repeat-associated protein
MWLPTVPVLRLGCQFALASLLLLASGHPNPRAQQPAAPSPDAPGTRGQSATLLPDGRWLLVGGEQSPGVVLLMDPVARTTSALRVSPGVPRAWHTATLLADGSVLVLGGIDARGNTISAPERFVIGSQTFESLPSTGFAPRARHTATTLTDGRVLIVGGVAAGFPDDAEIWNPEESAPRVLSQTTAVPRRGHTAHLLDDGRVFVGGSGDQGPNEVFDPVTNAFAAAQIPSQGNRRFAVAGVSPDGSSPIPVDARISIWLSQNADVRSLTSKSIALEGPEGVVPMTVVPVERGRLVFLTPSASLRASSEYRLTVSGAFNDIGLSITPFSRTFRTADPPQDQASPSVDDEVWSPDALAGPRGWRTNRSPSPWQSLPPLQAPPGVTALAGQVLRLNGQPLADVTLQIEGHSARTDRSGRFLLLLPGMSGRQELEIDGASANRRGATYGFFEAGLSIAPGQTTVLPYTIWMPRIDTAHRVRIPSPTGRAVVVTTPRIPGLELHIPADTVIRDHEGKVVRELSITPIPVDRPPFPLPVGVEVPVYFTIQPGGAYVYRAAGGRGAARLIYPNYQNVASGVIAKFWHYDPDELDWYVYGAGVVRGRQVIPNPGVSIYEFTGAMINTGQTPPPQGPSPFGGPLSGDPVDLGTGLFILEKTDLSLSDVLPLTLRRTYRPNDAAVRPFGIGSTHDYAIFLYSEDEFDEVDLILPNGARVHYVRISPPGGFLDAEFEHTTSPSVFFKSRIKWNGAGWDLRLKDGTVYVFGEETPLQSIRDRYGNSIRLTYSSGSPGQGFGNILRVDSPNGRWIEFTYDGSNRVTQARDNMNRVVGYQYDGGGRLWKVTDVSGGVTEYTYDTSHRLETIKDARGIVFLTNQYDSNGRVSQQTQADATTFGFSYTLNGSGKVTQAEVTDPRGYVSRAVFNAAGYATTLTDAVGTSIQRTHTLVRQSPSNLVDAWTDPLNRVTEFDYDTFGNLTSMTRLAGTPDAVTSTWTYEDVFHQVTTATDPLNHTSTISYDVLGRATSITDALSHTTTLTYNEAGQPLTVTDPLNNVTSYGYSMGSLVSITSPLGHVSTRFPDGAGRIVQVIGADGARTRYEYSPSNRLKKISTSVGDTSVTYDANGNLTTLTDARGKTTTWTYNNMDRTESMTDPLDNVETYSYDANGNLVTWVDGKGQVTKYQYDALNRRTFVGFGATGNPPTYASTLTMTLDAGSRLTNLADSVSGSIVRTYNLLDRLTQEQTPDGTVTYTYDDAGRRATMQITGRTQVSYTFDAADRLTNVTQGTASAVLAYDNANRRTSLTLPNGTLIEYGYDDESSISVITYKHGGSTLGTLVYSRDSAGRPVTVGGTFSRTSLPAALSSAVYNDANQVVTFGGVSFTYDDNGNLLGDGVQTYGWNARNELSTVTGPTSASFSYDGLGRRRTRTTNGSTNHFVYDGLNLMEELSGGSLSVSYLTGAGVDEYFTRADAGGTKGYLPDTLGGTVALVDAAGAVQTEYNYSPFGEAVTSGAPSSNRITFTGRESESSKLYYYRARYYDSRLSRFLSRDPIGFAGGINMYAYSDNAPTVFRDPLGLQVTNYSPFPYWAKPERDGDSVCVPPGGKYDGPVDGVASPWANRPDQVFKNLTGTTVVISPDGTPMMGVPVAQGPATGGPYPPVWYWIPLPGIPGWLPTSLADRLPGWQGSGFADRNPNFQDLRRHSKPSPSDGRKECPAK